MGILLPSTSIREDGLCNPQENLVLREAPWRVFSVAFKIRSAPNLARRGLMAARILDGNKIASEIRAEIAREVNSLTAAGMRPGLAVVLVGNNPASEIYVRGKVKSSEEVGIYSEKHTPAVAATTEELVEVVEDLNRRDEIDGILVQ